MGFFGRQGNSPGGGGSLMLKIIGGFLGLFFVVIGTGPKRVLFSTEPLRLRFHGR